MEYKILNGLIKGSRKFLILAILLLPYSLFIIPNSVAAATLSKPPNNLGLVGYWSFNEGTSTQATDFSGRGKTGTFAGSVSWVSGKLGTGVSTGNSTSDKITTDVDIGSDWTASVWFKYPLTSTGSTWHTLFRGSNDHQIIVQRSTMQLGMYDNAGGTAFRTSGFVMSTLSSGWHHIATVGHDTVQDFYIDGVFVGDSDVKSTTNIQNIGNCPCNNQNWGQFDEVRIYDRALTAAEVAALYGQGGVKVNSSQTAITNGLVSRWTFDGADLTDKVYDRVGNNNGYYYGSATSSAKVIGKVGQALTFSGNGQYVLSSQNIGITGVANRSVSVWFKTGSTATQGIVGFGGQSATQLFELVLTSGTVIGHFYGGGNDTLTGAPSYSTGQWNHAVITYDGTEADVYINGVYANSKTITLNTADSTVIIGDTIYSPTNRYFAGSIDDVRVYNRALSASEVTQIYNEGAGTKTNASTQTLQGSGLASGLVGLWTFDGKDMTSNVADVSGAGNNGFLQGQTSTTTAIGKIGQALKFDGTDDYVNAGVLSITIASGYTVSAWIKNSNASLASFPQIITSDSSGSDRVFQFRLNTTGRLELIRFDSSNTLIETITSLGINLNDNEWHHVTATFNSSVGSVLYIDGAQSTSSPNTTLNKDLGAAEPTLIGARRSSNVTSFFGGPIDDVRIYNRALSAAEVLQLYNAGK